jgi:fucose permease
MVHDPAAGSVSAQAAATGLALFVVIGATVAMFGPTIPAFRSTFHLTAAAAGLLLSGHFAGSLVGTLAPSILPHRYRGPRRVACAATLCFALGCLMIGAAPGWPVAVVGAAVEGAGWGGLVIAFNALFSSGFGAASATMLTLLNAVYGVGAILGPAGVALFAARSFRGPFLAAAVAALVLVPAGLALPREEALPVDDRVEGHGTGTVCHGLLATFMVAFFLYGGLEVGMGAWQTTHLVAIGFSVAAAATITSLFWASFTAGRLIAAPVALWVTPDRLVLGCLAIVSAAVLCANLDAITPLVYIACGLALGPVFPLALVWSGRVIQTSQRITAFVISGDLMGATVLPALLGQLVTSAGVRSLPVSFSLLAAGPLCLLLAVRLGGHAVPSRQ